MQHFTPPGIHHLAKIKPWFWVLSCLLLIWQPINALAQSRGLDIDIIGGNVSALPITIVPMAYQGSAQAPSTDVAVVVQADLERSGQFRTLPEAQIVQRPSRGSEVQFPIWRALRQDYLVVGRILDAGVDSYRVEYELFDVAKGERLIGLAMISRSDSLRDVAHQMADAIYERILGVRGAFWTRIAYVTVSGSGDNRRYALMVADADGHNPQTIVRSAQPLMSPNWHPNGRKIAYVSFERGNSSIYVQDIASGTRELLTSFRGINSAPAFSPDGNKVALSLSRSGNPEIYVMDLQTRQLTQLTRHFAIDTEPTWSADGQRIYFTSDRGGRPQIYQVPASGGEASRMTFEGNYNATASVSADGLKMTVTQGNGNVYRIALMDLSLGEPRWSVLSPGNMDESSSLAPNASMVLYAASQGGRGTLYVVSADGRTRQRLVLSGAEVREPAWGPYRTAR